MPPASRYFKLRFGIVLVLLGATFLMGGASRLDVASLVILQPLAAICAGAILLIRGPVEWRAVRTPLLGLGALAAMMAAQLVPLPPAVWTSLPGHAPFTQSALAAQIGQPWRPISLTPDLTLASLIGLLVPAAVLTGYAAITNQQRTWLLTAILIGSAASAFFGVAQVSGGANSPFYTYDITNEGLAVGLFANRNHQAVLLAMTIPFLAVWAQQPQRSPRRRAAETWIAAGLALVILPLLLITGSRAGLALGAAGSVAAAVLCRKRFAAMLESSRHGRYAALTIALLAVIVIGATIALSRAQAVQRLLSLDAAEDVRAATTPVVLHIVRDFLPIGSGFGSFDPVYRSYEPFALLGPQYLNHAHNDLLELVMTAGLPGALLALLFLVWFAQRALAAWRSAPARSDRSLARVASIAIVMVLLSSLVDYPLRTPLMMAIFTINCAWLEDIRERAPGFSRWTRSPEKAFTDHSFTTNSCPPKKGADQGEMPYSRSRRQ